MYPSIPAEAMAGAVQMLSYLCTVVITLVSFVLTLRP